MTNICPFLTVSPRPTVILSTTPVIELRISTFCSGSIIQLNTDLVFSDVPEAIAPTGTSSEDVLLTIAGCC